MNRIGSSACRAAGRAMAAPRVPRANRSTACGNAYAKRAEPAWRAVPRRIRGRSVMPGLSVVEQHWPAGLSNYEAGVIRLIVEDDDDGT